MIPHLLVVGARNSDDMGPDWPCKRLSGERGGRGGPISEEIGTPLPSNVSLTPTGLTGYDSERLKETEEEVCCPRGQPGGAAIRGTYRRA
jgi:hypothetical protein